jgi:hypothetical protein
MKETNTKIKELSINKYSKKHEKKKIAVMVGESWFDLFLEKM